MFDLTQRALAFLFAVVTVSAVMPTHSSAQLRETRDLSCAQLRDPEQLADLDFEDFLHLMALCPGAIASVKTEESSKLVRAPGVREREEKSKVKVRPASTATQPAAPPPIVPADDGVRLLHDNDFSIRQKTDEEVREINGDRFERREENTRIRGDDYEYDLRESREESEVDGQRTDVRESEERLRNG